MGLDVSLKAIRHIEIYSSNITHNLTEMAEEAGLYEYLWRPEKLGITKAYELIEPLTLGLELLKSDPDRFRKLTPSNNWGSYPGLLDFVRNYLNACIADPEADICVSR